MIEQLSNIRRLNSSVEFRKTEKEINRILLLLHQQSEKTGCDLLEQLSEAYAHQYDVVFAEGFSFAAELAADLLRIRYFHSETDE